MNLPFSYQQKLKIAISLFLIMVCTLLIRILEDKSLKNMGAAFTSIYNDRLIPATDLFQISEHIYQKSLLFDVYFHQNPLQTSASLSKDLSRYDLKIDSLLKKYRSTFLVVPEEGNLQELSRRITANKRLEKDIYSLPPTGENLTFANEQRLKKSYLGMMNSLSKLTKIQSEVGEGLIKESQRLMVGNKMYSTLQFVFAITIGVLIVSILYASNVIKIKTEKFNLN